MSTSARKMSMRVKMTAAFKQNEKLFRVLIENSSDALALVSKEGVFVYVSPPVQKILGYTPDELLGRSIRDLFPPDYGMKVETQFQAVVETPGLVMTVEHPYLHKNGSVRWIESTVANHLDNPSIQAYIANFRDITERKQAEEKQHVLNEASNILVSSLDHLITLKEVAQLIVPALADYCRIALLDEHQQIKEITVNHIDPAKLELVQELYNLYKDQANSTHGLQKLLETGKPELIPFVEGSVLESVRDNPPLLTMVDILALKSYMGVPLIARERIIGAITFSSIQPHRHYTHDDLLFAQELARRIALALDNTLLYQQTLGEIRERKKIQEALKESEAHKVAVFDTALDPIITMDHTGKIVEFNPAAERTFGYTRHEVIGQDMAELIIPPSLRQRHRDGLAHYLATGEGAMIDRRTEIVAMRKDGSEFPIELAITRVPKAGAAMFTGTIRDITGRIELERRKDEFISMASHELKTPVTSLKGFTNLFQRRLAHQTDEKALYYLDRMNTQLNKLTKLISDLLDVSKIQTGKLTYHEEAFDIDALVKETIENLQAAISTHQLCMEGTAGVQVFGDRDRIGQVLINLVTNAVKYSPHKNTVIIGVTRDDHNVIVNVQDFGIGIAKEHQDKIFDRFYQVTDPEEKTYPGLGIGLYLSHEIIERHGGRMWVESEKGQGATFYFTLPITV
ncbi:MAG TPA: PAS domain S-box protein [Ktedonobacteraceae bacterium]|nr:PAS domain S-box protein [Ktedonobacteraceae bacterium]